MSGSITIERISNGYLITKSHVPDRQAVLSKVEVVKQVVSWMEQRVISFSSISIIENLQDGKVRHVLKDEK